MNIRPTHPEELSALLALYEGARERMAASGNPHQWGDRRYPPEELLRRDIAEGHSMVMEENGTIIGTFCFALGEDPTYAVIRDGAWLNDRPYGTIHRIAGDGKTHGIVAAAAVWAERSIPNLRMDTHADNLPMQRALARCGFVRCGIIRTDDGTDRIAYQRDTSEGK